MALIQRAAMDPAVDPAKLRELLAVQQEWRAGEAKAAFARDMARFQAAVRIVEKGDTANGRAYARIDRIHREIRPHLRECGFWVSWERCDIEADMVILEGTLGHRDGHTVAIRQHIPMPDKISGTNAAQRAGSAQTYAKRYGECLVLGVMTGVDDDGGGGAALPSVTREQEATIRELCEERGRDVAKAMQYAETHGAQACIDVLAKGAAKGAEKGGQP